MVNAEDYGCHQPYAATYAGGSSESGSLTLGYVAEKSGFPCRVAAGEALVTLMVKALNGVPKDPGLYAMYGGVAPRTWVAYVGQAGNLAQRLSQHLERRSSSVTTGTSAVGLNVDHVTLVAWWVHPTFRDKNRRLAAELIAFRILDPALRSRRGIGQSAEDLSNDPRFASGMEALLRGGPTDIYRPPTLSDLAESGSKA